MNSSEVVANKKIATILTVFAMLVTVVSLGRYYTTSAQRQTNGSLPEGGQNRRIEKKSNSATPTEPVEITSARTRNGRVELGQTFVDDDEWTKGLTLSVRNTSLKNIAYINVRFSFERPVNDDQPPLVHSLTFGSRATKPSKLLAPGDSVDISLPDSSYEALKKALVKVGYPPTINHLKVYLSEVIFEDGTMWSLGRWFRRDRANPENWIPIADVGGFNNPKKNAW